MAEGVRINTEPLDLTGWAGALHDLTPVQQERLENLEHTLRDVWELGRNIILLWSPRGNGIVTLVIPHYAIVQDDGSTVVVPGSGEPPDTMIQEIVSGPKLQTLERIGEIAEALGFEPQLIELGFEPGPDLSLDAIDSMVKRYSLSYVNDRAVALFDIVGFSLYSPLEQVAQLNSLSYSVNAAHSRMLSKKIDISFARTTTGDGFYVWNRDRSMQANINLYHFMHLVLADNALARAKSEGNVAPLLPTSFHVGGHYEFYQAEGLNPTIYSYIVGEVTIELARLLERAVPGQVVVGDFQVPMPDLETKETRRVDSIQFIEKTQQTLANLNGMELSGEEIDSIKCYLTGERGGDDSFSIKKYRVTDKHGLTRNAYNAKINIYRQNAAPIFLGVQDGELGSFAPVVDGTELSFEDA